MQTVRRADRTVAAAHSTSSVHRRRRGRAAAAGPPRAPLTRADRSRNHGGIAAADGINQRPIRFTARRNSIYSQTRSSLLLNAEARRRRPFDAGFVRTYTPSPLFTSFSLIRSPVGFDAS